MYIYAILWNVYLKQSKINRINCVLTEFIVIIIAEQNSGVKLSKSYISHSRPSS